MKLSIVFVKDPAPMFVIEKQKQNKILSWEFDILWWKKRQKPFPEILVSD